MIVADASQTLRRPRERDVPIDFAKFAVLAADQRPAQAVRVLVKALQPIGLWTQIAPAMGVEFITADRDDFVVAIRFDCDAAMCLTKRTRSVGRRQ